MIANKSHQTAKQRFYILLGAVILSLVEFSILKQIVPSQQLFVIRLEQVFGLTALAYWYLVFAASPISKIFKKSKFTEAYLNGRRALGVSVAYFAVLHSLIAFFGQLNGFSGLGSYPRLFGISILLGAVALMILLIMAATSFDKIVDIFGFKRWKLLHRLSYLAGYLVLVHIWMIGTHISSLWLQFVVYSLTTLLLGLDAWRLAEFLSARYKNVAFSQKYVLFAFFFAVLLGLVASIPLFITSYNQIHNGVGGH